MSGTFSGLNTAYSALVASRQALEVTGQNVANANTAGYTRQRANLQSVGAPSVPARYSTYQGTGDGVKVQSIDRVTDTFLQARSQAENAKLGQVTAQSSALSGLENIFSEQDQTGISAKFTDFFTSWSGVESNSIGSATGESAATAVLGKAQTLVNALNSSSASISQQWTDSESGLVTSVDSANQALSSIASLNEAIRAATQSGSTPNELLDQRDGLVDQLAKSIGATTRPGKDGVLDVLVSGTPVVTGTSFDQLEVQGATGVDTVGASPLKLVRNSDGYPLTVSSGSVGGQLDSLNTTLPSYQQKLDGVASTLASSVNALHRTGFDANGNPGQDFFVSSDGSPTVTAKTISLGISSPQQLASSAYAGGQSDTSIATKIAGLVDDPAGAATAYDGVVVALGTESKGAQDKLAMQTSVAQTAVDALTSVNGVDTDEEMTNLLAYQRSYQAAAKVVSTIDSTLESLINMI